MQDVLVDGLTNFFNLQKEPRVEVAPLKGGKKGRMKRYLFSVEVRDGEHEYLSYGIVVANDEMSADRKAFEKAKRFLGSRMKWNEENHCFEPADGSEYRMIEYGIVGEATPEAVMSRLSW